MTGSRGPAATAHHIATQPVTVLVSLTRNLLRRRDHTLRPFGLAAHPCDDQATRIGPAIALDHTGDDLALMGGELAVGPLVLGVPEPLQHHLSCGRGGDASETLPGGLP